MVEARRHAAADRSRLERPAPVTAAGGEGPVIPALEVTVGERIDLGPVATNAANMLATRDGTWVLNDKRSDRPAEGRGSRARSSARRSASSATAR